MNNKVRRILPYKDVPDGSLFRVLKETGFSSPREGVYLKVGNSHATRADKDAIFALSDMVCVIRFPEAKDVPRVQAA